MFLSKKIIFIFLLITPAFVFGQEIKKGDAYYYARKIVDTLASESMHGRGYVNGGDSIAADYIKTEFNKFGLKPFGDKYYQRFGFAVNTFPGHMVLVFSAKDFEFVSRPGRNFIVDPSSPTDVRDWELKVMGTKELSKKYAFKKFIKKLNTGDFVVIDDREILDKKSIEEKKKIIFAQSKCSGYGVLVKKLTWDQLQTVSEKVKVEILVDSFPKHIKSFTGAMDVTSEFRPNHVSQNVIGYIKGSEQPDSFIVYTAHYDHLGQMGEHTYFPGANDNASGCAMLLNLAKYYSMPEHAPKCSIAFMAFCGEEVGLLGSKYYTEHPLFPLKQIKFLLNMDIMGTGEEGITVVNGTLFKKEFDLLKQINTENKFIKDVKIRGKAANSDHYWFSEKGVRACFIYTMGGIKAYHDIDDKAETLPLNEFQNLFLLITKFTNGLSNE